MNKMPTSNKCYMKLNPIEKDEYIISFMENICFSNHIDYENEIKLLIEYKNHHRYDFKQNRKGRKRKNIYAYEIITYLPYEIDDWTDELKEEFIINLATNINEEYDIDGKYLWIARCETKAGYTRNLEICRIIFFTREVYSEEIQATYSCDYFYNRLSGKRCREEDKDSVLKHRKGDLKYDSDGNAIMTKVSPKDSRIFTYSNFSGFIGALKDKFIEVCNDMIPFFQRYNYEYISKRTIDTNNTDRYEIQRLFNENRFIDCINDELINFQFLFDINSNFDFEKNRENEKAVYIHSQYIIFTNQLIKDLNQDFGNLNRKILKYLDRIKRFRIKLEKNICIV